MTIAPIAPSARHLFCFGCGYTARVLARTVLAEGGRVSGTCRNDDGVAALEHDGICGHRFDGSGPLDARVFAGVTDLLVSIPPGPEGDGVLAWHAQMLAGCASLGWIGLLSTTGVYGDCGGAWIDESQPLAPRTDANRWRVAAETSWRNFGEETRKPVQVFRLPGIYGPGRSPFDPLRAGVAQRIVKPGQVFNRIHVDDIAAALRAAMDRPAAGPIFHLADDEPTPADHVLSHAAGLLGLAPPPEVPIDAAGLSPMALHFYAECKRLENDRMKAELGIVLRHPTYREGLAAILEAEGAGG